MVTARRTQIVLHESAKLRRRVGSLMRRGNEYSKRSDLLVWIVKSVVERELGLSRLGECKFSQAENL